jgi:hypothetical protein
MSRDGQVIRRLENYGMNIIIKGERNVLHTRRRGKANRIGHNWHRKFLLKKVLERKREESIDVNRKRGRRLKQLLEDLKEKRGYWK